MSWRSPNPRGSVRQPVQTFSWSGVCGRHFKWKIWHDTLPCFNSRSFKTTLRQKFKIFHMDELDSVCPVWFFFFDRSCPCVSSCLWECVFSRVSCRTSTCRCRPPSTQPAGAGEIRPRCGACWPTCWGLNMEPSVWYSPRVHLFTLTSNVWVLMFDVLFSGQNRKRCENDWNAAVSCSFFFTLFILNIII